MTPEEDYPTWYTEVLDHVSKTPPACLSAFRLQGQAMRETRYAALVVNWKLACACNERNGQILGYSLKDYQSEYKGKEVFISPLAFACSKCEKISEIIDTGVHGFDGETCRAAGEINKCTLRGEGMRSSFSCPSCQKSLFRGEAICVHSHFDVVEDQPELMPRSQDFFDGFNLEAECCGCGTKVHVADFELA